MENSLENMTKTLDKFLPKELKAEYTDVIDMYDSASIVVPQKKRTFFGPLEVARLSARRGILFVEMKEAAFLEQVIKACLKYEQQGNRVVIV